MDIIDLADPIRLLILLLPERYRDAAAVLLSTLAALQLIAASVVARLPLAAARDPRWGRVVRALHWYSLLRFRDEKGTTKSIGAELAPRVTVAPPAVDYHPPTIGTVAEKHGAVTVSETRPAADPERFDPSARQTIVPEVAAQIASETLPRDPSQRGSISLRALLAIVVGLAVVLPLGVGLYGCPRNPPVSGCQPEAQTCINDRPHVCSASQRWHVAGDRSCASIGGVCTVLGGRAYCGPVADGGL